MLQQPAWLYPPVTASSRASPGARWRRQWSRPSQSRAQSRCTIAGRGRWGLLGVQQQTLLWFAVQGGSCAGVLGGAGEPSGLFDLQWQGGQSRPYSASGCTRTDRLESLQPLPMTLNRSNSASHRRRGRVQYLWPVELTVAFLYPCSRAERRLERPEAVGPALGA